MNLKALRKRLSEIRSEAQGLVDAADKSGGDFTQEQQNRFDALMEERSTVEANIKRLESLETWNDDLSASAGRAAAPATPVKPDTGVEFSSVSGGRSRIEDDPMRGFESAAEFGLAVQRACLPGSGGRLDERLQVLAAPSNPHRETGSADGYEVPPQMSAEVEQHVFAEEGLLARVDPEPTSSNAIEALRDESTPWGSAGIQAYWASENSQMTRSRQALEHGMLPLHKLYAFVEATEELLEDAPRLNARLTKGAAAAIRWKADEAIVNDNGAGKPLGWHNAANGALVVQAKESGQAAGTVVAANVLKMRSRLLGSAKGAFWLAHSTTIPQLAQMSIGNNPVWVNIGTGLREDSPATLLGIPVLISEHCQVVGTQGDIQLVRPAGYHAAVKRGGIKFAMSMHLFFDYDVSAFRWTFRLGGKPKLEAAVTQAKGGGTLSPFITLATRA